MLFCRTPDSEGKLALQPVYPSKLQYEPDRRRVILFPGGGVSYKIEDAQKQLAGSLKYIDQSICSARKYGTRPIDTFVNAYDDPYEDHGAIGLNYSANRDRFSQHGQDGLRTLLSFLLKDNEAFEELSSEELKKRLSHITLVGHSFGSIAIQDTVNALIGKMRRNDWDDKTISDTVKQLVAVNVAPIARTDLAQPNATQYFFTSLNDMTAIDVIRSKKEKGAEHIPLLRACGYRRMADIIQKYYEAHTKAYDDKPERVVSREQLLADLKKEVESKRHPGTIPIPLVEYRRDQNQYVIKAMLPDDEIHWIEQGHDGKPLRRTLDKAAAEANHTAVVHDFRTYLYGEHRLGEALINVLNNAVEREDGMISDGYDLGIPKPLTREQLRLRNEGHHAAHGTNGKSTPAETRSR